MHEGVMDFGGQQTMVLEQARKKGQFVRD